MKLPNLTKLFLTCVLPLAAMFMSPSVRSQLPPIVDGGGSQTNLTVTDVPNDVPQVTSASVSNLRVMCQGLKTVVQKGDRQAVMVTWNYDGFGREFTPEKRCQMVSERLQQAANSNGGTFKDLQLASGTVNSQAVICALQSNSNKCDRQNLLFTLKPENARNPDAIIQKIFSFAQDGSSSLDESASSKPRVDLNLGNWEQQAFPRTGKTTAPQRRNADTGF
ncbi:COP23 domain-containing protein [Chamaesiphon sp.]|uniref:COP23 domain-containing protein n=1 Tax=Chamaesiphon sp. TaxID=2814140 RepID=UPI003593F159